MIHNKCKAKLAVVYTTSSSKWIALENYYWCKTCKVFVKVNQMDMSLV